MNDNIIKEKSVNPTLKPRDWRKNKMAKEKVKSTEEVIKEKLRDEKFKLGETAHFDRVTETFTTEMPRKADQLETEMKGAFFDYKRKWGDAKADGLVEEVFDVAREYLKDTIGLTATNERGQKRLDNILKKYIPFDQEETQKNIDKSLKKVGFLSNSSIEGLIGKVQETYQNEERDFILQDLGEKIEKPEVFKEFKKYIVNLGKSVHTEIKEDDLLTQNKAVNEYFKVLGKLQRAKYE